MTSNIVNFYQNEAPAPTAESATQRITSSATQRTTSSATQPTTSSATQRTTSSATQRPTSFPPLQRKRRHSDFTTGEIINIVAEHADELMKHKKYKVCNRFRMSLKDIHRELSAFGKIERCNGKKPGNVPCGQGSIYRFIMNEQIVAYFCKGHYGRSNAKDPYKELRKLLQKYAGESDKLTLEKKINDEWYFVEDYPLPQICL